MEATERIIGVSLGPGDPELITLKGLNALQQADVIFCPATNVAGGETKSRALDILKALPVEPTKIQLYQIPMSQSRTEAIVAYDNVFEQIVSFVAEDKIVALVAEGDACFYSSANYLYEKLDRAGFPIKMVAGVPAFIAASSSIGLHLVKQQERMVVIPGDVLVDELLESVVLKRTLVIMKVSLGEAILRPFIIRHPELEFHYFENIGTPKEYRTSKVDEIPARPFIYFSILIIRAKTGNDRL